MIETYSAESLGKALAERVASDLRAALEKKTQVSIAVSGGSTPAPFLVALAKESLDWAKVVVTLTDERQVAEDSPRSNARLVSDNLLQGEAAKAEFLPLYSTANVIAGIAERLDAITPFDVCVLGMGADMHTASLFPGTPGLEQMLDLESKSLIIEANPPKADEPRVTLTAKALTSSAHTYLLIKGIEKRAALDHAMSMTDTLAAPIRFVLDTAQSPVVFYAD